MLRFVYFWACAHVALDTAGRAAGLSPEHLLPADYLWVNYLLAVMWLAYGIGVFFWRPR